MKNKITDLNDHLFAQLERLSDEDVTGDKLAEEINRAKAVAAVSQQILGAANVTLKAADLAGKYGDGFKRDHLPLIEAKKTELATK